jgi:hypothetical protein
MTGMTSEQMNAYDRKQFEGFVREWDAPRPAGLYLTLHHGRDNPEEHMDDWGYDGPIIGPFKWCHITYNATFNFGFPGIEEDGTGPCTVVTCVNDLVVFQGKYYGDWEFQLLEEVK